MKIRYEWHIPTADWEPETDTPFQQDVYRATKYFKDRGNLHWPHGRGVPTTEIFYVQSNDGQVNIATDPAKLYLYLDANEVTEVINARIPLEFLTLFKHPVGPLLFVANRHPDHATRIDVLCYFVDRYINHPVLMKQPTSDELIRLMS